MEKDANDRQNASGYKTGWFAQAWLVLLLALIFGSALAAVQVNLSDVIAANKLNETLEKVPGLVLGPDFSNIPPDAKAPVQIDAGTLTLTAKGKQAVFPVYRVSTGNTLAGWVLKASGQGYADKIELLIGLNPSADTISGLFILEQKETPGLGNKIVFPQWRDQFIGKKTAAPLHVTTAKRTAADSIDAVTGATISSRSVTDIVNQTVGMAKGQLRPENIKSLKGAP